LLLSFVAAGFQTVRSIDGHGGMTVKPVPALLAASLCAQFDAGGHFE
jgi:hypothetical protein